jgi:hypothetical protein
MTITFEICRIRQEEIHYYQLCHRRKIYEVTGSLSRVLGKLYRRGFTKVKVSTENFGRALTFTKGKYIFLPGVREYCTSLPYPDKKTYYIIICTKTLRKIWGQIPSILYWKPLK